MGVKPRIRRGNMKDRPVIRVTTTAVSLTISFTGSAAHTATATTRISEGTVMHRRITRTAAIVPLILAVAGCAALRPGTPAPAPSLYARLGGYAALAAVTDDILAREVKDPVIAPFFKGLEARDVQRIRQHLLDQLCTATGGPCFYPGKDMKAVHAEMEITDQVWNTFTGHIGETLAAFKVPERERNELVVIVQSLKQDIVNKK
jgi:hemoglobin